MAATKAKKSKKLEEIRQPKNGKPPKLRVVGFTDGNGHKAQPLSEFAPSERVYFRELHTIVDQVYSMADADRGWTWSQLADHSGLAYQTVANLGDRKTKRPQFRTVWRLCKAVGLDLVTKKSKGRQVPLAVKMA